MIVKTKETKQNKKRVLLIVALVCCSCIFLSGMGYLGVVFYDVISQRRIENKIGEMFDSVVWDFQPDVISDNTQNNNSDDDSTTHVQINHIENQWGLERRLLLEKEEYGRELYADILEINPDFLGMIEIPGLIPSQPFVHSHDNEEYLTTDFNGNNNRNGTVFLGMEHCRLFTDNNSVLYGHYTSTGGMFSKLERYKNAETFRNSPIIVLNGLIGESTWIVFAAHVTEPTLWFAKPRHDIDHYAELLEEIKARSIFVTDVDVTPNDRIITLMVCDYSYENMRFVVHARRLRDGETIPETIDVSVNENRMDFTVPDQQPLEDAVIPGAYLAINPGNGRMFFYHTRAGGIERYSGDKKDVQGPYISLSHSGITAETRIAAFIKNVRESDDEDTRSLQVAVQGVNGGFGITMFSALMPVGNLRYDGLITPEGVDARFPTFQTVNNITWLLYSVPLSGGNGVEIYRQNINGEGRELLRTVYGSIDIHPLGFYYVDNVPVIIWYDVSTGWIWGVRSGEAAQAFDSRAGRNASIVPFGEIYNGVVNAMMERNGRVVFTAIDLNTIPRPRVIDPDDILDNLPEPDDDLTGLLIP
ncbi:MAG: class B sortase [Oscillospiraceae bacterium]|jgi:sortase B|nr:class B sortase [Oscillospiraceae bacterium]